MENNYLSEKELSNIFKVLKHPLRRTILKKISQSPQGYSQLLKCLDIKDSSFLNYHLREMDNLLIKKDTNGKYELNEIGKICVQLIFKVKEKEDLPKFEKLQIIITRLKSTITLLQMTFSILVIILLLELYWLNIMSFPTFLEIFVSGIGFSIILSTSIFLVLKNSDSYKDNNMKTIDKLAIFSTLYTIWILVQTIITLFML